MPTNFEIMRGRRSIRRGFVLSFSPTTWTAYVTLDGSLSAVSLPVGQWVSGALMTEGAKVAVLHFDEANPSEGVIVGAYGAVGGLEEAYWYDYPLLDAANVSGCANHFRTAGTYPAGWTEVDAAASSLIPAPVSFWSLVGSSSDTTWKYRKKSNIVLESMGLTYQGFAFGPLMILDGVYAADVNYYFGIYRDNAGAIDEQTYIRINLKWNAASSIWQIRGEEKDGTTAHTGTYVTLTNGPLIQPLFVRVAVLNWTTKYCRAYWGSIPEPVAQTKLLEQAPTTSPTWGNLWVQVHQARAAGVSDRLFIGAVDYLAATG